MSSFGILLVEDEPINRTFISTVINDCPEFELLASCQDVSQALLSMASTRPDLVLLDIQLPGDDGFALLEAPTFRALDPTPLIVFITAFDHYAIRAFEVHAVDYVLKPFGKVRLLQALDHAHQRLAQGRVETAFDVQALLQSTRARPKALARLQVKEGGRTLLIPVEQVDWVEAKGNYAHLHTQAHVYRLRQSLTSLEQQLGEHGFARVHRSRLVNLHRVQALEPWFHGDYILKLSNGQRLKLSRRYKSEVLKRLELTP